MFTTDNCHSIPYSLAYNHLRTFSSTFCFQDLSSMHSNMAHALVHTFAFHTWCILFLLLHFPVLIWPYWHKQLDLILFMNLVALSVVLLAFASNFCNEVCLFPKRGLLKSIDVILLLSLCRDANSLKCDCELDLSLLLLLLGILWYLTKRFVLVNHWYCIHIM